MEVIRNADGSLRSVEITGDDLSGNNPAVQEILDEIGKVDYKVESFKMHGRGLVDDSYTMGVGIRPNVNKLGPPNPS